MYKIVAEIMQYLGNFDTPKPDAAPVILYLPTSNPFAASPCGANGKR